MMREYPDEIQSMIDLTIPYILEGKMDDAPAEVKEAYEKVSVWMDEQGQ